MNNYEKSVVREVNKIKVCKSSNHQTTPKIYLL